MNIKRLLLAIITVISLYAVVSALGQSLGEPQVQANLQLYQSNLILHVSEFKSDEKYKSDQSIGQIYNEELLEVAEALTGENAYSTVEQQYQEALKISQKYIEKLDKTESSRQLTEIVNTETPRQKLKEEYKKSQDFIHELTLKLGILEAQQDQINFALERWQTLPNNKTAAVLINIWKDQPEVINGSVEEVNSNLDGWFRYKALKRIYTLENNQDQLFNIEVEEQKLAEEAILTLLSLSVIPVLGGILGFGLIIFLAIQALLKKEESILATNNGVSWETPWNWEVIWQVLIVGFLFVSQIIIPILFQIFGFNPTNFVTIRGKALYVLMTYLLMSVSGLLVLYFSIKSFLPLPQDWFKFKGKKWLLWGIGGYLSAIPIVFLVSFFNQQLWDGQGGSNPLLFLALKAQDQVALIIFFVTASIAAPIFEEIIFRGFLLPSLTRYVPVWGAILISALVFAFAHLSLSEVIPLATLGVILGVVYTKSRSLLSSILVHSLWNSGTLLSLFILGRNLN